MSLDFYQGKNASRFQFVDLDAIDYSCPIAQLLFIRTTIDSYQGEQRIFCKYSIKVNRLQINEGLDLRSKEIK